MSGDCFIVPDFSSCDHGLAHVDPGLLLSGSLLLCTSSKVKLSQGAIARKEQELPGGWGQAEQDRQVLSAPPSQGSLSQEYQALN